MKRKLSLLLIAIISILALAGCSGGSSSESGQTEAAEPEATAVVEATEDQEPMVMRIGHVLPIDSPRHQSFLQFKEEVEEKTGGGIKVEIYPAGQLGTEAEVTDMVKFGSLEATRSGSLEPVSSKLLIYTMPFLFDDIEQFGKVAYSEIGDQIAESAKDNNIIVLATGRSGGFRQFTNNERPITNPEDMEGLKMRTPPIESIIKIMEAIGANPVSVPFTETYMALKTGVADGEENPYQYIESMKFYEVQKYLTIVNYQLHPEPFAVNKDWYEGLSAEYQTILKDAAVACMKYNDELVGEQQQVAFDIIKNSMEINELTEDQRQVFIEKTKPVYDYYIDQGIFSQEELDAVLEAIQ